MAKRRSAFQGGATAMARTTQLCPKAKETVLSPALPRV